MFIKVKAEELFLGENVIQMFQQRTEDKDSKDKIPFELTYWVTKLEKKVRVQLTEVRADLKELNDSYDIKQEDERKPLLAVLGTKEKVAEFSSKRGTILEREVLLDILPKRVSLFNGTGIGGVILGGLMPFLEDDMDEDIDNKEKEKNEEEKKDEE